MSNQDTAIQWAKKIQKYSPNNYTHTTQVAKTKSNYDWMQWYYKMVQTNRDHYKNI